jgi:hypothetical protein
VLSDELLKIRQRQCSEFLAHVGKLVAGDDRSHIAHRHVELLQRQGYGNMQITRRQVVDMPVLCQQLNLVPNQE